MGKRINYTELKRLQFLIKIHTASFNFALTQGLRLIVHSLFNSEISNKSRNALKLKSIGFHFCNPYLILNKKRIREIPRQSREIKTTYKGDIFVSILIEFFQKFPERFVFKIGKFPIMVNSIKCNLYQLKPKQLIEMDEEEYETGGYFIIKGNEKILRLLILPKRNKIKTFSRISNSQKGFLCTVFSSSFRSVNRIQVSKTIHLHYLSNGTIHCRIIFKKQEFFFPVVFLMKVLLNVSDRFIFDSLTNFDPKDQYIRKRAVLMIRESYSIFGNESRTELKVFLGKIFNLIIPQKENKAYEYIDKMIEETFFVHLGIDDVKKFQLLLSMIHRLILVQRGLISEDNPDSFDSQEFLLPGNLLLIYLREKITSSLYNLRLYENFNSNIFYKIKPGDQKLRSFIKNFQKEFAIISQGVEFMITTGNYSSGLLNELPQNAGLSVTLERINYGRFFSFFRSVHRGKFFLEMKNTTGRKLLPQSWGFLCPIHTPDGPSCGILNHLSFSTVSVFCNPVDNNLIKRLFIRYGKIKNFPEIIKGLIVLDLDGEILGYSSDYFLRWFIDKLRSEKVSISGILPKNCELFFVSRNNRKCPSRQFYLSSQDSRASRPVKWYNLNLNFFFGNSIVRNKTSFKNQTNTIELIGVFEQNLLNIFNFENQTGFLLKNNRISHSEIDSIGILSIIAGTIPFSNLNQSPRNIYQCQMSKQSIGVPFYTFWRRNDSKSYFLLAPQVSIVRNKTIQDGLKLDGFPNGFNACISILTYTGFDMEDAIVINRSSVERGISFSNLTSCNLFEFGDSREKVHQHFSKENNFIEQDGLLKTNSHVSKGNPIFSYKFKENMGLKKEGFFCYNSSEKGVVDQIKLSSVCVKRTNLTKTLIKIRSRRKPITGDKFASRHGQKGVLSKHFSSTDLPFSEIGIVPDMIFNPNGLPSRMTIGLIIEGLAGKTGSVTGSFRDSSPFRNSGDKNCLNEFSNQLRQMGFQYFGSEILYSGYSGEPLEIDIFTGIVHYQRLRHMVSDKFQISNKSPINNLTRQPVKGRKSGGAIRFGEMERDALLGHGCTFLLHDRIQVSSDLHVSMIEKKTGCPLDYKKKSILNNLKKKSKKFFGKFPKRFLVPYILKYLMTELAAISIKLIFNLNQLQ